MDAGSLRYRVAIEAKDSVVQHGVRPCVSHRNKEAGFSWQFRASVPMQGGGGDSWHHPAWRMLCPIQISEHLLQWAVTMRSSGAKRSLAIQGSSYRGHNGGRR